MEQYNLNMNFISVGVVNVWCMHHLIVTILSEEMYAGRLDSQRILFYI